VRIPRRPQGGRRGVRTHRSTLVFSRMPDEQDAVFLHDNQEDPFQLVNIAAQEKELVSRLLREELIPWLEKTNDPGLINFSELKKT